MNINQFDDQAVEKIKIVVARVLPTLQPRPRRGRRGRPSSAPVSAAAEAVVTGILVRPHAEIPGAQEKELGDLSAAHRQLIDPNGDLALSTQVWELHRGNATVYQTVEIPDGPLYASPKLDSEGEAEEIEVVNMARLPIKADKLCQAKSVTVGEGESRGMIDVDPC